MLLKKYTPRKWLVSTTKSSTETAARKQQHRSLPRLYMVVPTFEVHLPAMVRYLHALVLFQFFADISVSNYGDVNFDRRALIYSSSRRLKLSKRPWTTEYLLKLTSFIGYRHKVIRCPSALLVGLCWPNRWNFTVFIHFESDLWDAGGKSWTLYQLDRLAPHHILLVSTPGLEPTRRFDFSQSFP